MAQGVSTAAPGRPNLWTPARPSPGRAGAARRALATGRKAGGRPSSLLFRITPSGDFFGSLDPSCHWIDMSHTKLNVLLVDDNKANRLLVRQTLLQTGLVDLRVEEAENGSDALAKLANLEPDLILSDWSMPEMNGVELLRELRSRGCGVKFGFVMPRAASAPMREKAFEAGAQ